MTPREHPAEPCMAPPTTQGDETTRRRPAPRVQLADSPFARALAEFRARAAATTAPVALDESDIEAALAAEQPGAPARVRGLSCYHQAMRFIDWADARSRRIAAGALDHREVCDAFPVSRATAYRWLAAWRDLRGVAA